MIVTALPFWLYTLGLTIITFLLLNQIPLTQSYIKKRATPLRWLLIFLSIFISYTTLLALVLYAIMHLSKQPSIKTQTLYLQAICSWLIVILTLYSSLQFLKKHLSILTWLRYSFSIILTIICGRILFLGFIGLISQTFFYTIFLTDLNLRFLFFITVCFFINIALLHFLTKTRLLFFLPDNRIPTSALLATSLSTVYSVSPLF